MTGTPSSELLFRAVDEPAPGARFAALFGEYWPAYRTWFLREGDEARPTYGESRKALETHMPELAGTYDALAALAGGGDTEARFLSLYCPTPALVGCSQAIWTRGEPALVRNYDYSPDLSDGVILASAWNGRRVVAMTDCLWGVLDGINDAGLAVALSFGGSKTVGKGFAATLVLRYALETAATTREAVAILTRVPVYMAYNVSVVDETGDYATVYIAPDREPAVKRQAVSTNHQQHVEWAEHAEVSQTLKRQRLLEKRLDDPAETLATLIDRFLEPPLYRRTWSERWGTLYTAAYEPAARAVTYRWPGHAWPQSIDGFAEGEHTAHYGEREQIRT